MIRLSVGRPRAQTSTVPGLVRPGTKAPPRLAAGRRATVRSRSVGRLRSSAADRTSPFARGSDTTPQHGGGGGAAAANTQTQTHARKCTRTTQASQWYKPARKPTAAGHFGILASASVSQSVNQAVRQAVRESRVSQKFIRNIIFISDFFSSFLFRERNAHTSFRRLVAHSLTPSIHSGICIFIPLTFPAACIFLLHAFW